MSGISASPTATSAPRAVSVAGKATDGHRRARRRHRDPRPGTDQPLQLFLDLRPGPVGGLGRDRLRSEVGGAVLALAPARGRRRGVTLLPRQRVHPVHRRDRTHDLDGPAAFVVAPLEARRSGPGVEQAVQRAGPHAAARRQPVRPGGPEGVRRRRSIALLRDGRGAREPNLQTQRRLDARRQRARPVDPRQRQRHRVRRQKPCRQPPAPILLHRLQPDVGTLHHPHRGIAGAGRRRTKRGDLAIHRSGFEARVLHVRQAAARKRGREQDRQHGSRPEQAGDDPASVHQADARLASPVSEVEVRRRADAQASRSARA